MFKINASKIKDYLLCRAFYYDRYILGAAQIKDTSAMLGTALHKAIEDRYRYNSNPYFVFQRSLGNELTTAQDRGDEIKYRLSYAEMIDEGRRILEGYDFTKYSQGESEIKFTLPFYDDVYLSGVIDRISNKIVLDYKSAKSPPSDLENDPQFTIYTWAYQQLYGELPDSVYWYHLRTHTLYAYDYHNLEEKLEALKQTINIIRSDTFTTLSDGKCKACVPWCKRN